MKKDNCKDCVSKCEHAGKDREFVCVGGVSCKKTQKNSTLVMYCPKCGNGMTELQRVGFSYLVCTFCGELVIADEKGYNYGGSLGGSIGARRFIAEVSEKQ